MNGKLYIFYHVFCNDKTPAVVREQIQNIHFSGIYRVVDAIYYCLAGTTQEKIDKIVDIFGKSGAKFRPLRIAVGDRTYERLTFGAIRDVIGPEDVFCYIHSKGVSHGGNEKAEKCVNLWRQKLEYYLFTRAPDYLHLLLDGTYDVAGPNFSRGYVAGANFSREILPHFSGNFWWCRGKYYLNMQTNIDEKYIGPEMYILSGAGDLSRVLSLKNNAGDHYSEEMTFDGYVDEEPNYCSAVSIK